MPAEVPSKLIGVIHLLPLPGAPVPSPGLDEVERRAIADAITLAEGGIHCAVLENLGDAPFTRGQVGPEVVAAMTRIALSIQKVVPELELGINVLRNDGFSALAIAAATGAAFVRVNVLAGSSWTDQGLIEGDARDLLLLRRRLQQDGLSPVLIAADICVKHGVPAGERRRVHAARDTAGRGGADILIVSGAATGAPTDLADLCDVRAAGGVPVWVGSGVTVATAAATAAAADGAIVGTALHLAGDVSKPICPQRVRELVKAYRSR